MRIERQRKTLERESGGLFSRIQILGPTSIGIFGTLIAFMYLEIRDLLIDLIMGINMVFHINVVVMLVFLIRTFGHLLIINR